MVVFLFSVFWLHVNEFNSFWEELRGRGQEVVAYSDAISTMLNLFSSFTDDKMIPQALSLYMIHLSLYCRNISFLSMRVIRCMMHIS